MAQTHVRNRKFFEKSAKMKNLIMDKAIKPYLMHKVIEPMQYLKKILGSLLIVSGMILVGMSFYAYLMLPSFFGVFLCIIGIWLIVDGSLRIAESNKESRERLEEERRRVEREEQRAQNKEERIKRREENREKRQQSRQEITNSIKEKFSNLLNRNKQEAANDEMEEEQ